MGVPGASRFLGAATLANQSGIAAQSPTVLSQSASGVLDAGRRVSVSGKGISASARQLNQAFLNRSSDINALFSLGLGISATAEGAAQAILGLRATLNDSQLSRDLRSDFVPPDPSAEGDDGSLAAATTGQTVDTTA